MRCQTRCPNRNNVIEMSASADWLIELDAAHPAAPVEGLVPVAGYQRNGQPPDVVAMMERAELYGAQAVFFEAGRNGRTPTAQAFIFVSDGPADDPAFARLHQRLWSWGGVPLLYRKTLGLVQLFRCGHEPDFVAANGDTVCRPYRILDLASQVAADPWWDAERLRNGTLWDDPAVCKSMLSAGKAAHRRLIDAVRGLNDELNEQGILPRHLRRRLLILSLLIAYLEERGVLLPDYFKQFLKGASQFFEVLADGDALVKLLAALEERFNGNVFSLTPTDRQSLRGNGQLARFAKLVEGREELNGQLTFWQLYSFKDLPVELISHIYQLFVRDSGSSVYTPPFLVRLMLDEALSWERLDRFTQTKEVILDPSCGSGVFLVEAYKRLVLHWRSRNDWKRPGRQVLKSLLQRVHGVDLEEGAVELAAFSLCLALCDALEPEAIRSSIKLFPALAGNTLHHSCFFEAKEKGLIKDPVGVVTGNPPFDSKLTTPGAERSYARYQAEHGPLPDKQLAYLFLHESMEMVAAGGIISLLQQYNFLYNHKSLPFRHSFIDKWDVREVLDFVSVRGLFQADTKVVVVLAEASSPTNDRKILHATFRRSGRVRAEQGFDIDYYDLHWVPRNVALANDGVWRANLLSGGRVLSLVDRLRESRTLDGYVADKNWDRGEGFTEGSQGRNQVERHVVGKPLVPSDAIVGSQIDRSRITKVETRSIERARTVARYTPPMLLIRKHMELEHALWTESYLTYKSEVIGICAPPDDISELKRLYSWFGKNRKALRAFIAATSPRMFTQKATTLSAIDVLSLPCPESWDLDISENEKILIDDIVDYYGDLVRLGEDSPAMKQTSEGEAKQFADVYTKQINAIYRTTPLRSLALHTWQGVICMPFCFGDGKVDWNGSDALKARIGKLLVEQRGTTLQVSRITRVYDDHFVFLLKPNRLRYWLRSVALRDADETVADLRTQGF